MKKERKRERKNGKKKKKERKKEREREKKREKKSLIDDQHQYGDTPLVTSDLVRDFILGGRGAD